MGHASAEPWRTAPPLGRAFYERDSRQVAPDLLNKVLLRSHGGDLVGGRIVEVEAYAGADDPGSHAFRGRTARNATMFGAAGGLYVYFTYGMHWCANAVCGPEGSASAVLLRALAPLVGEEAMRERRRGRRAAVGDRDLCSGPAKLCQALGVHGADDGLDLTRRSSGTWIVDDGRPPPADPLRTVRVGLSRGADLPWRWAVPGDPNVSRLR